MNLTEYHRENNKLTEDAKSKLKSVIEKHNTIIILGNGGSSSISSHISQDYTKKLKKKAFTFSDPSRLTCYANDYGYEQAYVEFLKESSKGEESLLVVLISSSGNSENIIRSAYWCKQNNIPLVILSGFKKDNLLKEGFEDYSSISFWVDSSDYGVVECVHQSFLHMAV
jgi:D-sedoheptulose 7-phosphate isomerase